MHEVVKYAANNSKLAASKKFGVRRKLVQTRCKHKNDLLATSLSRRRLPGGGMKAKYRDIDEQLYQWLLQQLVGGRSLCEWQTSEEGDISHYDFMAKTVTSGLRWL